MAKFNTKKTVKQKTFDFYDDLYQIDDRDFQAEEDFAEEQNGTFTEINDLISKLPQLPQVQYDLTSQLRQLARLANKFGFYDAADYINERI